LYDASPGMVIEQINGVGDDVAALLVVGHEPTMTQLALGLAAPLTINAEAAERISTKFPTSAMAVLRLNGNWADLELGSAQLADFHVPR
jgi:phosphohistidine phosphatase